VVMTPHLIEAPNGQTDDSKSNELQQRRKRSAIAAAAVALDAQD
jgi:hypothetical protein